MNEYDGEPPAKRQRQDPNACDASGDGPGDIEAGDVLRRDFLSVNIESGRKKEHYFPSNANTPVAQSSNEFDVSQFISVIGEELPIDSIKIIQAAASNNIERAVNMYFDGSWKKPASKRPTAQKLSPINLSRGSVSSSSLMNQNKNVNPALRYVGSFGVDGWATRSGTGLLKHGDAIMIDRTKLTARPGRGSQKSDVLTRFTNMKGQEIGRIPHEVAEWISPLVDQNICSFKGVCVFVDDRIRINDTICLQITCFMKNAAFRQGLFSGSSMDDNRNTGIFDAKESSEERNLRLRQVGLIKLFDAIDLKPTTTNPTTVKHKRDGILRAAEMAEQFDGAKKEKFKSSHGDNDPEDETPELEADQLDTLYQKAQSFDFNMPEAIPSSSFNLNLRKYQRQALYWMMAKERDNKHSRERSMHPLWEEYTFPTLGPDNEDFTVEGMEHFYVNPYSGDLSIEFPAQEQHCLGGILADEMGLGKTIEMLSLVHSHKIEPDDLSNGTSSMNSLLRPSNSSGIVYAPYTTLVVAPTSLLAQWASEALKASAPGSMRVYIYYGNDKFVDLRHLCSAAKHEKAPHVIVTSYGVVLSEFRSILAESQSARTNGGLFSLEFFRIILDEAHLIKNRRSKSARACYELKATHRWVLTGTPIVNRLEDLFSLVRFLKVEPWSNFSFWKTFITVPFESKEYARALNVVQSVLEPLVLRRTKTMKTPEGEPLVPLPPRTITIEEIELPEKEREIYDLIYTRARRTYDDNVTAGTLLKSYTTIFAQILRLRQTCCHPILTRNKAIVSDEEDAALIADAANEMKDNMDLQELINQFTTMTEKDQSQNRSAVFTTHALRQIQTESSGECPICCEEPMVNPAVTACWHSACKKCLEDVIRHETDKGAPARCFSCRAPIDSRNIFEVIRHPSTNPLPLDETIVSGEIPSSLQPAPRISLRRINPLSPSAHTSAKIHALINHLSRLPSNSKSVVFSQFTSFLDLIGDQLSKLGINHLRLDGSMPQKARAAVLAEFTKETYEEEDIIDEEGSPRKQSAAKAPHTSPTVLLISLRAGGVGLNLTTANNVFLMDPWWSFAIEAQAIDRVHRMGQTREVSVTRFIIKDSIEGRMLRVQDRKMNIAGSLGLRVGGEDHEEDKKKQRTEELRMLFE